MARTFSLGIEAKPRLDVGIYYIIVEFMSPAAYCQSGRGGGQQTNMRPWERGVIKISVMGEGISFVQLIFQLKLCRYRIMITKLTDYVVSKYLRMS